MTGPNTGPVRFPPPLIYVGFLLAGWGLTFVVADPGLGAGWDVRRYIAFALIVGGLLLDGAAMESFRRKGTPAEPWKESVALETGGVFRFSRNPIYVGFALIYAGAAVWMDSLIALALLLPCMVMVDRFVVLREEAYLFAKFGADWDAYRSKVRRWL
ncbi:methyltransferase family protein [Brevundimonas sp.]|uniref:methyltransferase family protein n=1 Tax=Brevundimonas sp. TaxID=1871086 RepID=UPI003F7041C9